MTASSLIVIKAEVGVIAGERCRGGAEWHADLVGESFEDLWTDAKS